MGSTSKNWFRRRRYGWGWFPVTWQGWLILAAYISVIVGEMLRFRTTTTGIKAVPDTSFWVVIGIATICLIAVGFAKGPVPHWRWGRKDTDNPDEDR